MKIETLTLITTTCTTILGLFIAFTKEWKPEIKNLFSRHKFTEAFPILIQDDKAQAILNLYRDKFNADRLSVNFFHNGGYYNNGQSKGFASYLMQSIDDRIFDSSILEKRISVVLFPSYAETYLFQKIFKSPSRDTEERKDVLELYARYNLKSTYSILIKDEHNFGIGFINLNYNFEEHILTDREEEMLHELAFIFRPYVSEYRKKYEQELKSKNHE